MFIGGKDAPKTAKGTRYSISYEESSWYLKKDNRSDYVYQNSNDGRIMLSNSFCEEFQEETLENLASKTFKSIKDFRSIKSNYITYHDREAFRIEGTGLVDGVRVTLQLLNTRRDNCYFDFLSISPTDTETNSESFNLFLNSVSFK
jgi:hypothetical protein